MAYWDKQDPSIDGVLGGHGDVSEVQLPANMAPTKTTYSFMHVMMQPFRHARVVAPDPGVCQIFYRSPTARSDHWGVLQLDLRDSRQFLQKSFKSGLKDAAASGDKLVALGMPEAVLKSTWVACLPPELLVLRQCMLLPPAS